MGHWGGEAAAVDLRVPNAITAEALITDLPLVPGGEVRVGCFCPHRRSIAQLDLHPNHLGADSAGQLVAQIGEDPGETRDYHPEEGTQRGSGVFGLFAGGQIQRGHQAPGVGVCLLDSELGFRRLRGARPGRRWLDPILQDADQQYGREDTQDDYAPERSRTFLPTPQQGQQTQGEEQGGQDADE